MDNLSITYVDYFINQSQKEVLSLKNIYSTMLVSSLDNLEHIFRIPIDDIFIRYRKELEILAQVVNLPEKYYYQPKKLSLELYGTTELWLSLLRLNEMVNITEFDQPVIMIYNPNELKNFINVFFKREKKIT